MSLLLVALAGAVGALARVLLDAALTRRLAPAWPAPVLAINIVGSLLLGLVTGLAVPEPVRLLVGTGFCGAFTTFSTASLDAVLLLEQRRPLASGAYVLGGLVACVLAAGLGLALGGAR